MNFNKIFEEENAYLLKEYINKDNLKQFIHSINKKNRNLLHVFTLHYTSPEFLKLLIEAGIDINQKDFNGNTALHYAICNKKHGLSRTWSNITNNHNTSFKL